MTQDDIPSAVKEYAHCYAETQECDCADRFRYYCDDDDESYKTYHEIRDRGCCGFVDYQRYPSLIDGRIYYFGFNYGH